MAGVQINPVAPPRKKMVKRGGKLGEILGKVGAVGGGIIGGFTGGPMGALQGATTGATMGSTLGGLADPGRMVEAKPPQPQSQPRMDTLGQLSQKYKLSDNGRIALNALQVAQRNPQYQEYIEPLGMAVMTDIGQNNQRGMS
jgi:hypothetical protein